ncbi:inositol 3-kinase isoform X1 [Nymphaea colorata]|nr:inositol 3-kinase isoform X1 [Nymphaea colorata]
MGRWRSGSKGLVVGNYCHDVILRDGAVVGESLGGAASFIANVLDLLDIPCTYVSKVGPDFAYSVAHLPCVVPHTKTTLFHAHFFSPSPPAAGPHASGCPEDQQDCHRSHTLHSHQDRTLKLLHACEPISISDLPLPSSLTRSDFDFDFGMAVGVAGEITPETLSRLLDLCRVLFVDVQALIRTFDVADGTVSLAHLRDTHFVHLLPRISFLKASSDEAEYIDIQDARNSCCVIVTDGREGCRVYWKDGEFQVPSFPVIQMDPTGAGDSFLGGFAAGLVQGLSVKDAALLGNFFGSLTVGQIGVPRIDSLKLQMEVKYQQLREELTQRTCRCSNGYSEGLVFGDFQQSTEHEEFRASLARVAKLLNGDRGNSKAADTHEVDQVGSQWKTTSKLLDGPCGATPPAQHEESGIHSLEA